MKKLTTLLLGLILFSCSVSQNESSNIESDTYKIDGRIIIDRLDSLGFYDITDSLEISEAKECMINFYNKSQYFGGLSYEDSLAFVDNRFYFVDNERLFESGGITEYLDLVKNFFERKNLKLEYSNENEHEELTTIENNYWLHTIDINGGEYIVYDGLMNGFAWSTAFINFAKILNTELEKQNSKERVYLVYWDNDAQIVFLTTEMYESVCKYYPKNKSRPMEIEEWRDFYGIEN